MGSVDIELLNRQIKDRPNYSLYSIDIIKEVNKIPTAIIVLLDGEASKQEFKVSNEEFFSPGQKIEIKLGYQGEINEKSTVF